MKCCKINISFVRKLNKPLDNEFWEVNFRMKNKNVSAMLSIINNIHMYIRNVCAQDVNELFQNMPYLVSIECTHHLLKCLPVLAFKFQIFEIKLPQC